MDLISVVIPVYNVENCLDKCVESIVNQTYRNLEIILVDDGSSDKCPSMCDEWAKKDSRIKVIHKENGGVSSARNAGLKLVGGKYVSFVDSDDYLEYSAYEIMYNAVIKDDFDICVCNFKCLDDNNLISYRHCGDNVFYGEQILKTFFEGDYYNQYSVCNKMYKSCIIKANNIMFEVMNKYGEDFQFNYKFFKHVEKLISVKDCLYIYLRGRKGAVTTNITRDMVNRWQTNYLYMLEHEKNNSKIYKTLLSKHAAEMMCCCRELLKSNNKDLILQCYPSIVNEVEKYYKEFMSLEDLSFAVRLSIKIINLNPSLFKTLYGIYIKCSM